MYKSKCKKNNHMTSGPGSHISTFSKQQLLRGEIPVLVPEAVFPFHSLSPKGFTKKPLLKHHEPWTKQTTYEVNHSIANFFIEQKSIWKSDKKTKVQECLTSLVRELFQLKKLFKKIFKK